MKNITLITLIIVITTLTACGGGSNNVSPDSSQMDQQQEQAEVFVIPIGGIIIFPLQDDQNQDPPTQWHNESDYIEVWWKKSLEDPIYPFTGWRIKGVKEGTVTMCDLEGNLLLTIHVTSEVDNDYAILADTKE